METKVVSFKSKNEEYEIVVGEETAISRLRRGNYKLAALKSEVDDVDIRTLQILFYPDCVAAVVDWKSMKKPTMEEFALLPGPFVDDWATAVWELNPQWQPNVPENTTGEVATEEDAKKASNSISD